MDKFQVIMSINNLSKMYKGMKAVDNLSFDVYKGEVFGFLGPNGAGKTTTINMICGLLKADWGDIVIDGISIKDRPKEARSLIGMCPQNIMVWKDLTCMEQIEFMGSMYDISVKETRKRGVELLEAMGLMEKKDKKAKALSGGMQRRLNIILALVHNPKIIILDEPEAGLDPQSRVLVREYIKKLASNKTVVLTTHNMDEAERMADRVAILDRGKLLDIDTPDNLKNSLNAGDTLEVKSLGIGQDIAEHVKNLLCKRVDKVSFSDETFYITGENLSERMTDIFGIFSSEKVSVEDVRMKRKTLEDVFIHLTGRGLRE